MGRSKKFKKVLDELDAASRLPTNLCPPIERRIEQHLAQFDLLRAAGLKWSQIVLGLPSWSQKDGTPVSADQLRGAYSRVSRKQKRLVYPHSTGPSAIQAAPQKSAPKPARIQSPAPAASTSSLMAQLELTRKLRQS